MHTRTSRTPAVVAALGWIVCWGCVTKTGKETSLADLQGKTLDLGVSWLSASPGDSTRVGEASLGLHFSDVGKMEGSACPIVHASATFGGVTLKPTSEGGAAGCGFLGSEQCSQECLFVAWYSDRLGALLETLPQTLDLVLEDGSETAIMTVRNPAPMATVTVLDLVERQQVRYGDSFHVELQPQPPATIEDIQGGVYVDVLEHGTLPISSDPESGIDVWRVDVVPPTWPAGTMTLSFGYGTSSLHFDFCSADFGCSGDSQVEFGDFALQYLP